MEMNKGRPRFRHSEVRRNGGKSDLTKLVVGKEKNRVKITRVEGTAR